MLDKQKSHNVLLNIINATVSHELRNPLNSIVAQNLEKRKFYQDLRKISGQMGWSPVKNQLETIISKLEDGLFVQESSSNLMIFIIQDLLDYAQLKAGKFRKNLSQFDVRDAVEQIMQIQMKKALDQKINFHVLYDDIDEDEFMVVTDKQRMQ